MKSIRILENLIKKQIIFLVLALINQLGFADNAHKHLYSPASFLGAGYSDDMQTTLGMSCLKAGEVSFEGGSESIITLGKSYSFDAIQKELNTSISADIGIDMFSADARSSYARYISNSSYSESFYYLEKITLPSKLLATGFGLGALNPFGLGAYKEGPDQFRISCGNKFHQQVIMGANFFTTFKIVFSSAFDKSSFDASLGGGIGDFFSAGMSIQRLVQQKNIRGTLEISAFQEGGDPTQLAGIFSKCNDHYCITACSLDNLNDCKSTIDGIINYAQNNLPKQIAYDPKTNKVSGNANPLRYSFMHYSQLGLKVGNSQLTPEIIAARGYLGHLYKETLHNEEIVDHILNSTVAVSIIKDYKDKLLNLSIALHSNAALLTDDNYGAIGCYLSPKKCVAIRNQIDTLLQPVNTEVLAMFKVGYIDRTVAGPYMVIPIGGDQFQSFNNNGSHFTSQETIKLLNDGNLLHIEGINIDRNHFVGDLSKIGDNTFLGDIHYDSGFVATSQFTMVENPI